MPAMSIGSAAQATGLSIDTLRYYEKIGLLPDIARDAGGRRIYHAADLSRLRFIQRAQRCHFSLHEIGQLLQLRNARSKSRQQVQRLTERKLAAIKTQLSDLDHLQRELQLLLNLCRGSDKGCPILEGLEQVSRS